MCRRPLRVGSARRCGTTVRARLHESFSKFDPVHALWRGSVVVPVLEFGFDGRTSEFEIWIIPCILRRNMRAYPTDFGDFCEAALPRRT